MASNANPRKRPPPAAGSGADRKRAKFHDARTIAVQSADPELRAGAMDVNAFVRARQFEIKALEAAMASSKRANNKRAFQMVPRDMRRRTASHNVKRVPKRLRRRAAHEMKEDNTPTVTARRRKPTGHMRLRVETAKKLKQMAGKKELTAGLLAKTPMQRATENELRKPPRAANRFRKRQRAKTWLPSHIWHAKRARMATRWRFAVAETPSEKSYRPTHRASQLRGAVAWDESYFSTIHLKGREDDIKEVLGAVCGPSPAALSKPALSGGRACETWLYRPHSYPARPIAPAALIWCAPAAAPAAPRQLFVRIHPAAFLELWTALLPTAKAHRVTLEDLRFEIGSIEITGPGATDALLSVLHPSSPSSPATTWPQLHTLTNPSALPPGALLSFSIIDPRLRSPPRPPPDPRPPSQIQADIFTLASTWPVSQPPSDLFSRTKRTAAVKLQPSQKRVNRRKGAAPPGTYPPPLPTDPAVPILLFASRRVTPAKGVSGAIGSWTVMMPWKWVLPVWYALMNAKPGVRFGGLEELRQVVFESGGGCFPDDFAGTEAGRVEEGRKGAERREVWEKRPKGKRVEWGSVKIGGKMGEVGDGFVCDWEWLLKGEEKVEKAVENADEIDLEAVGASADTMDIDCAQKPPESEPSTSTTAPPPAPLEPPSPPPIWNIPTALITHLLASPHRPLPPVLASLPASTLSRAIFTIRLHFLHRGTAADRARIYRLPADAAHRAQWQALIPARGGAKGVKQRPKAGSGEYPVCPGEEDCIGFVTTGGYNLKEGMGVGVGALGFVKVWRGEGVGRVVVVRDVGGGVGRLARWEVV